jgi:hypothetical protein
VHNEGLIEPETHALSRSPIEDNQDHIDIDNESDYEPTKNHKINDTRLDVRSTPEINSHQAVSNQGEAARESRRIETNKEIDSEIIRFIEERRFLGILRKSVALGYPTEIIHHIYPPVRVYPDKQIFAQKSNFWLSPDLFTAESSGFSIQKLTKQRENVPLCGWHIKPLWLLFYLAALYGSEGRLKENDSPDDRLSLISKPDFDIVPNQLDYWKVSDYMINKKPQDIHEIADGSGVNLKTVIDFCNACEEIDIIERTASISIIKAIPFHIRAENW